MKRTFTKKQLIESGPCADGLVFLNRSRTLQNAWKTCKNVSWMFWALNKLRIFPESVARRFAVECAEHTLHFFEDRYPGDLRPRQAIEFARTLIDHPEAAYSAAISAAHSAAISAAYSAAYSAVISAAWSAAEGEWQADKLRELFNPFSKTK